MSEEDLDELAAELRDEFTLMDHCEHPGLADDLILSALEYEEDLTIHTDTAMSLSDWGFDIDEALDAMDQSL